MYRKTYVKINEEVLTANVSEITSKYPEYHYYFGVVKGNAYGHGMHTVNALIKGGVNYLAVATLEEAAAVRQFNKDIPILCLEPIDLEFIEDIIELNVSLTVNSLEYFEQLNFLAPRKQINVHIKLDTRMNRLGIADKDELDRLYSSDRHENVFIEGIYTHLATSGVNDAYYDKQMERFEQLTRNIDLSLIPIVHVGRSLILVHHKKPSFVNGVRLGICMYGFAQSINPPTGFRKFKRELLLKFKNISPAILKNDLKLNTAYSLHTVVLDVKRLKKGDFAGYGAAFKANEDMNVATLAIGYYDGMSATLKNVYINGSACPILGELCMDMTLVKVPNSVKKGDVVEIFGDKCSVRKACFASGMSAYRLLTGITSRVPRVYGEEIFYI